MKNTSYIFFILLMLTFQCFGQDIAEPLLPYLKGEKYGVVTGKGKTILSSEFDDIVIREDLKIISAKKGDLWGLYAMNGDLLLDHVVKKKQQYGVIGPEMSLAINFTYGDNWEGVSIPSLVKIYDDFAKVSYWINPDFPQKSYKAYARRFKDNKHTQPYPRYPVTKLFRVVYRDGEINFIDDKGALIFDDGLAEGFVITDKLFAVSNGEKYALQTREKILSEPIYTSFTQTSTKGLISGTIEEENEKGRKVKKYHLFDSDGKLIDKSDDYISSNREFLIVLKEGNSIIYGENGKLLHTHFNVKMKYKHFGGDYFLISENKYKYGLFNKKGELLLDTIQTALNLEFPFVFYGVEDRFTVLDSNFNQILELDSINTLTLSNSKQYFQFSVKDSWRYKYGLMDQEGKILIPPIWNKLSVSNCKDFVELGSDTSSFIHKIGQGKIVYPTDDKISKFKVEFNCEQDFINIREDDFLVRLDSDGKVLDKKKITSGSRSNNRDPGVYRSAKNGREYELHDTEGNKVLNTTFKDIDIVYDRLSNKSVYICQFEKKMHPSTVVYDDDLKIVTPEGYSVPQQWRHKMDENPGTLLVVNDADAIKDRNKFRMGMIDYEGNWLIQPFYGVYQYIMPNLIIVKDYDKAEYGFYNQKGEKATDRKYDVLIERNGSDFFQNRILVGVFQDKTYLDKVNEIQESTSNYSQMMQKIKNLGEPVVNYGYIDKLGNEIIEPQYTNAKRFGMGTETTFASKKDDKGITTSYRIDTLGNVLFSAPYGEMDFLGNTHYKVKKGDYWAISDTLGKIQTPYIFTSLTKRNYAGGIFVGSDSTKSYVVSADYKIREIEKNGRVDVENINDDYFYVKIANRVGNGFNMVFHLFSKELELIQTFENISGFSDQFNRRELPKDYITVRAKSPAKSYILNASQKTVLKE